jgi:hypothetical protein
VVAGVETTTITRGDSPTIDSLPLFVITCTGIDEDGDYSSTLNLADYGINWMPNKYAIDTVQSAGTTAVVDVALQGSFDGTQWEDIVTDLDCEDGAYVHGPSIDWGEPDTNHGKSFQYYRIYCTTVGAGNTLTAKAYIYRI